MFACIKEVRAAHILDMATAFALVNDPSKAYKFGRLENAPETAQPAEGNGILDALSTQDPEARKVLKGLLKK